ncbi:MAG TPA: hypothetical protein VIJ31_17355 [Acidothermaceae bacterium]
MLLAAVRSVGVQGDGRTYGHPIVLRPVSSEDAMTADWSRNQRVDNDLAIKAPTSPRQIVPIAQRFSGWPTV